jgi:hypothetical protein
MVRKHATFLALLAFLPSAAFSQSYFPPYPVPVPAIQGGTGQTSFTTNCVLTATSSTVLGCTVTPNISGANITAGTLPNAALVTTPVTSVTASGNLASSGGTTPAITLAAAPTLTGTNFTGIPLAALTTAPVTSVTGSGNIASSGGATPNLTFTGLLPIASGGTGTASPGEVAGSGIVLTGSFPTKTIALATAPTLTGTNFTGVPISALSGTLPTWQKFLAAASGTYTTPAGALWIRVIAQGAGGGGGGSGTSPGAAGSGGTTSFGSSLITCAGGGPSSNQNGQSGSGCSFCPNAAINIQGGSGATAPNIINGDGGSGGNSPLGGGGAGGSGGGGPGTAGAPNTGAGGGGAGIAAAGTSIGGAGAGGYCNAIINTPSATYAYTVGALGTAGTAGGGGQAGGAGALGGIWVEEHYSY